MFGVAIGNCKSLSTSGCIANLSDTAAAADSGMTAD
jgi:hypothetical protein